MKFSASNVDFNSATYDPIGTIGVLRTSASTCNLIGYPIQTCDFCYCRLI